ncbi:MAG TPA: DUF2397 family protein, partial [Actinomycetes bacterium]
MLSQSLPSVTSISDRWDDRSHVATRVRVRSGAHRSDREGRQRHTQKCESPLTANAALFMHKVNKLLGSPVVNGEEFALFKADTIAYLNDFLADLDTLSLDIRGCLDVLNGYGADALQRALLAGERSSGEFAPLSNETNPTWALVTRTHLAGTESWFRAGADAGA